MRLAATLDQWISTAASGLCDDAVQRIRTEITDHYQAARDSGHTPEAALAFFGDPKKANRQYRRVYLTQKEVVVAGALANPQGAIQRGDQQ